MDNLPNFRQVLASPRGIIAAILIILIISSIAVLGGTQNTSNNNEEVGTITAQVLVDPISPHVIVYGAWAPGNKSVVKGVNLTSGNEHVLAELPDNIKKVTFLPQDQFYFIDNTDQYDHGTHIAKYNSSDKGTAQLFAADDGFKFDDYVIAKNGTYMAVWEIALGTDGLIGGKSRVYLVDLTDGSYTKQLLADEALASAQPVFYPRAVTGDGKVVLDKWVPNDETSNGRGFGWGMFIADASGDKREIAAAGTYGSQPFQSPDGNYIAFAGYSGRHGSGTATHSSGSRIAQVYPDKVMVYNLSTETLEQQTDPIFTNTRNIFPGIYWDTVSGKMIVSVSGSDVSQYGFYLYDHLGKTIRKLAIGEDDTPLATLEGMKVLTGRMNQITPGNLGEGYDWPYDNPRVFNEETNEQLDLQISDQLIQYVGTYPTEQMQNVLGVTTIAQNVTVTAENNTPVTESTRTWIRPNIYRPNTQSVGNNDAAVFDADATGTPPPAAGTTAKDRLQLEYFLLKPSLAPVREGLQSQPRTPTTGLPRCRDLAADQCEAQGLARPTGDVRTACAANIGRVVPGIPGGTVSADFCQCWAQQMRTNSQARACYDSPLYLYGPEGTNVRVTAQTPIFNSTPSYENGYDAVLRNNGTFTVREKNYSSISYDYEPALQIFDRPAYGIVTSLSGLEGTIRMYGASLGLNVREADDLVKYARENVDSAYVFVSFFNQETSKRILPLQFNPKPDTYINYVFYFKELADRPAVDPIAPVFPPIDTRGTFTAVEISGLVE
jgi:hypothetical protein